MTLEKCHVAERYGDGQHNLYLQVEGMRRNDNSRFVRNNIKKHTRPKSSTQVEMF